MRATNDKYIDNPKGVEPSKRRVKWIGSTLIWEGVYKGGGPTGPNTVPSGAQVRCVRRNYEEDEHTDYVFEGLVGVDSMGCEGWIEVPTYLVLGHTNLMELFASV